MADLLTWLRRIALGAMVLLWGCWVAAELHHPSLPPGDGPLQTLNWLGRIGDGQIPGRDFPVFHGLGLLWVHAPFYLLGGGGTNGIILTYNLTSAVLVVAALTLALRIGWGRAFPAFTGALLIGFGLVNAPWNLARFFLPCHSMIGARAAGGLLIIMIGWWAVGRRRHHWSVTLLAGALAGLGWFFSNDQGPGVLLGLWLVIGARLRTLDGPATRWRTTILRLALWSVVLGLSGLATYLVLLCGATFGHPGPLLAYYFHDIPENQIWWFGGPPGHFAGNWSDLPGFRSLWVPVLCWLPVGATAFYRRRVLGGATGELAPLFCGLSACGILGCIPMLGMLLPHYAAGLVQGLVLAAAMLTGHCSHPWVTKESHLPKWLGWIAGGVVVFFSAQGLYWGWRWKADHEPGRGLEDSAQLARLVQSARPQPVPVWSLYRGLAEDGLDLPHASRWDYIIHALGREAQAEYDRAFERASPLVVRTIRPDRFEFHEWLWHTRWGFFKPMVRDYRPAQTGSTYTDWTRRPSPLAWEQRPLEAQWVKQPDQRCQWSVKVPPRSRGLLVEIRLRYADQGPESWAGPVNRASRKLTRLIVTHPRGALDGSAFAIPPPSVSGGEFVWPLIADGSAVLEGTLEAKGPLPIQPVRVISVEARGLHVLEPDVIQALTD